MNSPIINVLLVDDNIAEANSIMGMLEKVQDQEYSVQHVEYLSNALERLRNSTFDVVLTDLGLPDSQGLETAQAVLKQAFRIPVVVLTVLDDEDAALRSLEMGIQDYLIKGELSCSLLSRAIRYAIQRKRLADDLWESEQRFASFMLHMPAAAWMKDLRGRYVYANAEAERIFSIKLAELSGKSDDEVFPPETARQFKENDQLVLAEDRHIQTTEVLRQPDGIDHFSIVSKFAVNGPDGKPAYIAGVAFDITGRKQAEEALQKSEEKFSMIFNTAPVGITISTIADGRFVDINAAGLQFSGYRRDEVIGRTALEFDIWKDPQERARTVEEVLQKGEVRDREMMMKDREGNVFWASYSAVIVEMRGEKYLLSLVSDINDRKRAEEVIERLNTELEARAVELEAINRELEAFNYTVAHDLRNPLNVASCYCQTIRELCGNQLDGQCREYLQEAYEGTVRMNRLIDDLLNFSCLAHTELHLETVDLSAMAQAVAAALKLSEPARRVEFRIADGANTRGDAALLRVVLENLLGNAWKYTSRRDHGVIEFGATEVNGAPAWFVRDNGAGFDMADAGKIFLPFRRLSGAEKFKGHGIGLATVERIIRRHGGRIWAEGAFDRGATFYFTL